MALWFPAGPRCGRPIETRSGDGTVSLSSYQCLQPLLSPEDSWTDLAAVAGAEQIEWGSQPLTSLSLHVMLLLMQLVLLQILLGMPPLLTLASLYHRILTSGPVCPSHHPPCLECYLPDSLPLGVLSSLEQS